MEKRIIIGEYEARKLLAPHFSDFIQMGKHGLYVWSAYGVTFVVFIGLVIHSLKRRKAIKAEYLRRNVLIAGALALPRTYAGVRRKAARRS